MRLSDKSKAFAKRHRAITETSEYRSLRRIPRHGGTNTYDHSIRVARLASVLAPRVGVSRKSAARVGLLHDFCLIDYRKEPDHEGVYCYYHPLEAIRNSRRYRLDKKEKRAILSHMFPLSPLIPTSRLGYVLTISDKLVAAYEAAASVPGLVKKLRR